MIAISLQSGSSGNSIYVESGDVRLLFDAGITGVEAEKRLASFGRDIRQVTAVVISHDHSDHVKYAGVYQRKYRLPLHITADTLESAEAKMDLGKLNDVSFFVAGGTLQFGELEVTTYSTPHDGSDGAVFVVSAGDKRLGIMTDLGHVFDGLQEIVSGLDAVFMESNYDPQMLEHGPYPYFLRKRIKGPGGHISNAEAAELLLSGSRLKWACLSHLSGENNDPQTALVTHRRIIGNSLPLYTAPRYSVSSILSL